MSSVSQYGHFFPFESPVVNKSHVEWLIVWNGPAPLCFIERPLQKPRIYEVRQKIKPSVIRCKVLRIDTQKAMRKMCTEIVLQ